jgi:hypothetical protein
MRREIFSKSKSWRLLMGFAIFTLFFLSLSCTMAVRCSRAQSSKSEIVFDLVPTAQVTQVNYYLKKFKGKETIFFEIGVKNISNEPKRFKLKVFIHDGPSAAYYYPRKGKPPVIKPGEVYTKPLPVVIYPKIPHGFTIRVEDFLY